MIHLDKVSKTYRIPVRQSGLKNALKAFLKREYRYVKAVKSISLNIEAGSMVGYIGPNGSGKSTSIKILSGILYPDEGNVIIAGNDPFKNRKQHFQQIGVVFGHRTQLWWDLPVIDSFDLLAQIYKIPKKEYRQRLSDFITLFDLDDIILSPVRQLSLGQRVRCDIVASLLHNPKILFLDEPTIGLDAYSKRKVRMLLKKVNKEYNTTVILTTHDMQDIEEIVDRIILIGNGSILYDGDLKNLKQKYSKNLIVELNYEGILNENSSYTILESDASYCKLHTNLELATLLTILNQSLKINHLEVQKDSIDDIILNLYKDYQL